MTYTATPESSNLAGYDYDPKAKLLTITFKNGGSYKYIDVPEATFALFKQSESKGSFLSSKIKGIHKHEKIEEKK